MQGNVVLYSKVIYVKQIINSCLYMGSWREIKIEIWTNVIKTVNCCITMSIGDILPVIYRKLHYSITRMVHIFPTMSTAYATIHNLTIYQRQHSGNSLLTITQFFLNQNALHLVLKKWKFVQSMYLFNNNL